MRRKALLLAALPVAISGAALAAGFEPGQRWSCVTDQGRDGYLMILDVEAEVVTFSWLVIGGEAVFADRLCAQREALDPDEMAAFCRLLGDEISDGHARLARECEN